MKYTSSQIKQMTLSEWNDAMAKELNENGFKARGLNREFGRWENNRELYIQGWPLKNSYSLSDLNKSFLFCLLTL